MGVITTPIYDTLLHDKDSDKTERIILPITRYDNVLNAPRVIDNIDTANGAPFLLLATDIEMLSSEEINELISGTD